MNALFMLQTTAQCDHPSQVSARSSRHTASTSSPSAQQLAKHSVLAEGGRLPDVDCTLILCGQSLHLAAIIPPAAESPALTGDAPLLRGSSCERSGGAVAGRLWVLQDAAGCGASRARALLRASHCSRGLAVHGLGLRPYFLGNQPGYLRPIFRWISPGN